MHDGRTDGAHRNIPLSHPDYTVGPGITPGLLTLPKQALAG